MKTYDSPLRNAYFCALLLIIFALVVTFAMSMTYAFTKKIIAFQEQHHLKEQIASLVPFNPHQYTIVPQHEKAIQAFGQKKVFTFFQILKKNTILGIVLPIIAPDGYGGPIHIFLGVSRQGQLWGIRVTEHKETPGLGDYIDHKHSFPRHHFPWDKQFQNLTLPEASDWTIKKNGGYFDSLAGASISPQAVILAVHRAINYIDHHSYFFETTEHVQPKP